MALTDEETKQRIKELKTLNKERYKVKAQEYYKNHQEQLKAYASTRVLCNCGQTIARGSRFQHCRTNKHIMKLYPERKEMINTLFH